MGRYYNYLTRDGKGVPGVGVTICTLDGVKKDYEVTDENGFYQFTGLSAGTYQIRFFGMGFDDTSWFDVQVVGDLEPIELEPLVLSEIPILEIIEEEAYLTEQGEMGKIFVTVSGIDIITGKLANLDVYYQDPTNSGYNYLSSIKTFYSLDPDIENPTIVSGMLDVPLLKKPIIYDFKTRFFNPIGEVSNFDNMVLEVFDHGVELDGIADLVEYIGVSGLVVKNGNFRYNSNVMTIPTNEVVLTWGSPNNYVEGIYHTAAGVESFVTEKQLNSWTNFVIFMYVATTNLAPSEDKYYPIKTETNGAWYFLDRVKINRASLRVPKKKNIMLWIGFETQNTTSQATLEEYVF